MISQASYAIHYIHRNAFIVAKNKDTYVINHFIKGNFNYPNDEEWCSFTYYKNMNPIVINNDIIFINRTLNVFNIVFSKYKNFLV